MLTVEPERLELGPGKRVLDLGCGDGRHSRYLRLLDDVTTVALDLGEDEVRTTADALRTMEETAPEAGGAAPGAGPWCVVRGSGYQLPFADESFDCVIISEVLEHLDRDDDAIDEISRVLKPGGMLAVSVPREGPEAVCWALSWDYRNSPGGHVRIYRRAALRRKLTEHGYDIVGTHFAHALHTPYWWLKCLFGIKRDEVWPVKMYHRLLVWDMLEAPALTRTLERWLNPLIGKSVVFYGIKS